MYYAELHLMKDILDAYWHHVIKEVVFVKQYLFLVKAAYVQYFKNLLISFDLYADLAQKLYCYFSRWKRSTHILYEPYALLIL